MRHDTMLYLDLLRERAAIMDLSDEQVREIYQRLDDLPPVILQRMLQGDTVEELEGLLRNSKGGESTK